MRTGAKSHELLGPLRTTEARSILVPLTATCPQLADAVEKVSNVIAFAPIGFFGGVFSVVLAFPPGGGLVQAPNPSGLDTNVSNDAHPPAPVARDSRRLRVLHNGCEMELVARRRGVAGACARNVVGLAS
jgi:hypothetical protein